MYGDGWGGMGMGWMWIVWPVVILGVVLLVVFLVRSSGSSSTGGGAAPPPPPERSGRTRAQEILDERYARGEISEEEYQERLRNLRGEP